MTVVVVVVVIVVVADGSGVSHVAADHHELPTQVWTFSAEYHPRALQVRGHSSVLQRCRVCHDSSTSSKVFLR